MNERHPSPRLRTGTAYLTREGFLFAGSYYSGPFAIRMNWYAQEEGREVDVTYDESAYPPEELLLMEAVSEDGESDTLRLLDKMGPNSERIRAYQAKLRQLMEERANLR
ncbi:hypothetical protein [Gorillibacterium sp. sgz500922]|uniref:hypothetical protein n=1 Tax=Gorillibacterium sp. sgz500922 TaxID=3446694 RepID=UPI003F66399B